MKVRNGFVSNSSSSSFLIVYRKEADLERFLLFDGYTTLMSDIDSKLHMPEENRQQCIDHIYHAFQNILYKLQDDYIDTADGYRHKWFVRGSYSHTEIVLNMLNWAGLDTEAYYSVEKSYLKLLDKFEKAYIAADTEEEAWNIRSEFQKKYLEKRMKDKRLKKLAEQYYNQLVEKGLTLVCQEYSDQEDDEGSYMEHEFMPFLARDPGDKIFVVRNLNH